MEALTRSRTFTADPESCFNALRLALPAMNAKIVSTNADTREAIAYWMVGLGARYTMQILCTREDEQHTRVDVINRPDLTPKSSRPMGPTPHPDVAVKMELLLSSLGMYLDPNMDKQKLAEQLQKGEMDKKRAFTRRLIMIALFSVVAGAAIGLFSRGFTIQGLSTGLIAALICWVVFSLVARFFGL